MENYMKNIKQKTNKKNESINLQIIKRIKQTNFFRIMKIINI